MSERKGTRALELWCKRLVRDYPNVQIENMTTSWRNGLAFCALVHRFRPDIIDLSKLKPEDIYENNQLAFSLAEKHLGIPALLDPEDMVANEVPDRLSVLTYLSQFYQRLGHTVNTKVNDSDSGQSTLSPAPMDHSPPNALNKFGKAGLDKCAACDLPVYLAQRLIVSQKLYHRRCFRCSKCSGHLNPNSFKKFTGTEFVCDTCKTEKVISKFLNNNDVQMGMLAFTDSLHEQDAHGHVNHTVTDEKKPRPQSIIDKINMFEKKVEKDTVSNKLENLTLEQSENTQLITAPSKASTSQVTDQDILTEHAQDSMHKVTETFKPESPSENLYKSDEKKYAFLKTQLEGDSEIESGFEDDVGNKKIPEINDKEFTNDIYSPKIDLKEEFNVTDDTRLAKSVNQSSVNDSKHDLNHSSIELKESESEASITIPPRRKKRISSEKVNVNVNEKEFTASNKIVKEYPDHLNPFSEDEDEDENPVVSNSKRESTNPFGSSDEEEDDDLPPIAPANNTATQQNDTPTRRLISANPFWSDDEEPSTDEDGQIDSSSSMYKSTMTASTPNLRASTPLRKKPRAPPPPPAIVVSPLAASMDDVASISSVGSYNSSIAQSENKSPSKLTPCTLRKKRPAPTPPDSISTLSEGSRDLSSMERGADCNESGAWRHTKRPAPGLPLPSRREVKLQLSPGELQTQLDLLETQQLGLERQGVLIEQMIRDKCEVEDSTPAPQEEVEDLVIQLCELVNEKNDLFRKQTELMYIRRQQRLEQEQADIEHEIRVIQSRPAVNRIDADKAREEQLVSRLVEIVRLRDELVQSLDAERRRERQEDLAIAASIASRRAQRSSESNSSSLKSVEVVTPKKSKVKDKMKKQLKKAKHTFIHSKKKDGSEKRDDEKNSEKDKKSKVSTKEP